MTGIGPGWVLEAELEPPARTAKFWLSVGGTRMRRRFALADLLTMHRRLGRAIAADPAGEGGVLLAHGVPFLPVEALTLRAVLRVLLHDAIELRLLDALPQAQALRQAQDEREAGND